MSSCVGHSGGSGSHLEAPAMRCSFPSGATTNRPQTGRPTTTERLDSLPALGGQRSKIKMSAVCAPSDGCRRELFDSPSFVTPGIPWPVAAMFSLYLCLHMASLLLLSVCVSSSVRTLLLDLGSNWTIQHDIILKYLITSANTFF